MKELSIEEKAKAYDKVREKIALRFGSNVAEEIFSEFEESEDERIRKELITHCRNTRCVTEEGAKRIAKWIAWLEKQENKDSQVILPNIIWHDGNEEPEEQCEILCEWESKDAVWHDVAFYHADTKTFWNGAEKIEAVVRWIYVNEILEKQDEQKPTDKINPKFKVGDWVTNGIDVYKIKNIDLNEINYSFENGNSSDITLTDNTCHLWSIQDAKAGEVLSFNDGHGNDCIELIKSITSKKIEFWFCLTNGNRYEVFDGIIPYTNFASREDATPATKEQRDLLFAKMKEAGYEWDAEKKELKKRIEHNSAWSEEDMKMIGILVAIFEVNYPNGFYKVNPIGTTDMQGIHSSEIIKWLKSLKGRYRWKPSDEQIEAFEHFVRSCGESGISSPYDNYTKLVYSLLQDLKKLKEK